MSVSGGPGKLSVEEFACRLKGSMIPLNNTVSYFTAIPLSEDDLKEYLEDPVTALPPSVAAALPKVLIALVPYLERPNGKEKNGKAGELVSFETPSESRQSTVARTVVDGDVALVFAIKGRQVADYHHALYQSIAALVADRSGEERQSEYFSLLREELGSHVHGEVDHESWRLKQALMRRQANLRRETKAFREYARQSFIDTLTLYLHGICCDIDVDTGPKQLPSRYLRRRLMLLEALYPPPKGYAVFPEELRSS